MKFKRIRRNPKSYLRHGLLILVVIVISVVYIAQSEHNKSFTVVPNLSAQQFQDQSQKLISLMEQRGATAAFQYVNKEVEVNPSFAKECHPLLHTLGQAAYTFYGGYSGAISHQNEICDSGYTHGVLIQYFSDNPNIKQDLATVCRSTSTQNYTEWQCFHGMGHGIMLANNKNVTKSLGLCETLSSEFDIGACANGVFMEHFIIVDHEGNIPEANPTSLNDCRVQPVIYKDDCYLYAPTAYLTINDSKYKSALSWCNGAESNYVGICVEGVGAETMKENIASTVISKDVCLSASPSYRAACVSGAVQMYILFKGSSSAAQGLCVNVFNEYRNVCQSTITIANNALRI